MSLIAFDDELISCTAGNVKTFDASLIAPDGASKATRAVVQNSETADTDVLLRFIDSPSTTGPTGIEIDPGETYTIDGYENLVNAKFLLKGGTTASLFVTYFR